MKKKVKSSVDGRWTSDPCPLPCPCGEKVHFMLRGNIRLIPPGHKCKYRRMQQDQLRTIRAEESAGIRVTPSEAARRINEVLYVGMES